MGALVAVGVVVGVGFADAAGADDSITSPAKFTVSTSTPPVVGVDDLVDGDAVEAP